MGKIGTFISSFKAFMKSNEIEQTENRNDADDYAVVRSKTFYIVSGIISFAAAVLIWLVAVTNGTGAGEKPFAMAFEMKEYGSFISAAEQSGFNVVIEDDKNVSFTLEGRKKSVNEVTTDDIKVYIDLGDYIDDVNTLPNNTEQKITAKIIIDAPVYFNISDVSKTEVIIKLVPINKIAN